LQAKDPQLYTSDDLIELAAAEQITISTRGIRDWPVWGGLAPATPIGRGPSKGVDRVWTAEQAQVFMRVARARHAGNSRARVVNLPAFFWLVVGEEYVPIAQVRRAMATWIARYQRLSNREVRRSTDQYAAVHRARNLGAEMFPHASDELLYRARERYRPTFDALETKLQDQGISPEEILKRLIDEEAGNACANLLTWLGGVLQDDMAFRPGRLIRTKALAAIKPLIRLAALTRTQQQSNPEVTTDRTS